MLRLHLTQFRNSLFLWRDQHHENLALFDQELEFQIKQTRASYYFNPKRHFDEDSFHNAKKFRSDSGNYGTQTCSGLFKNYDHLIKLSTPRFQSKHLIPDYGLQQRLLQICSYIIDQKYGPYIHAQKGSDLNYDISELLGDLAYERLLSIQETGYFYAGHSACRRNTIIVSENLLLHFEKSNWSNFDLFFEVEQTRRLSFHLGLNSCGEIDHFSGF